MEGGERSLDNLFYASSSQCCQLDFGEKKNSHVKFKYDNPCEKKKKVSRERTKVLRRQKIEMTSTNSNWKLS